MGKIIAITGMGGTGKTTFAVNLACGLAEKEKIVIILSAEMNFGTVQHFFGAVIEQGKGTLESLSDKTEQPEKMLTQCSKVNQNIYIMGIPNENYEIYSEGVEELKGEQLLRRLSIISDYLIVDCTADWNNGLTILGIEKAEEVYCLYKATSNVVLWHRSTLPVISQLTNGKIRKLVSEHQLGCDRSAFIKTAEIEVYASLPNVVSAPVMENIGKPLYFSNEKERNSVLYRNIITEIAEHIILEKGE